MGVPFERNHILSIRVKLSSRKFGYHIIKRLDEDFIVFRPLENSGA